MATFKSLEGYLKALAPKVDGGDGHWVVEVEGTPCVVLADESHDRMRLMTPVAPAQDLSKEALELLMEANFDRALDAKYAIWRGEVWSVFMHPLGALSKGELEGALKQVLALRRNYGTSFASTSLTFGGDDSDEEAEEARGDGGQPGGDDDQSDETERDGIGALPNRGKPPGQPN